MSDISGIEVVSTGSRLLTAEDVTEVTAHIERLESENEKLRELAQGLWFAAQYLGMSPDGASGRGFARQMRELGVTCE